MMAVTRCSPIPQRSTSKAESAQDPQDAPPAPQGLPRPRWPPQQEKLEGAGAAGSRREPARSSPTAARLPRAAPRPTQVAAYGHKFESQAQPGWRGIFPQSPPAKKLKLKHIPPLPLPRKQGAQPAAGAVQEAGLAPDSETPHGRGSGPAIPLLPSSLPFISCKHI